MVTINNLTPQTLNGQTGTEIDYTVNFEGTPNNVTGTIVANKEDTDNAFKDIQNGDVFFGIKKLVLQEIATQAQNALNAVNGK